MIDSNMNEIHLLGEVGVGGKNGKKTKLRSLTDYVYIEIEGTLYNEDSGVQGANGENIWIDPTYDPQYHVKIAGKVVATPEAMSNRPISQETKGTPSYALTRDYLYRRRSDIPLEVEIGDIVYFHFNTLASMNGDKNRMLEKNMFKVAYENILCAVRNNKIIMIGGYCLIKPDIQTWEETVLPTPVIVNGQPLLDKNGQRVMKPKDEWIVIQQEPEERSLLGFVVNVGTPIKGHETSIKNGDHIMYHKNADWRQTIEGEEYFVIRQRHIIGKLIPS